jgi:hypothetical protein
MTAISRRETDPSTHPVLSDAPEEAKASSGVKGRTPTAAGSAGKTAGSGNHLEAYSGPSGPPERARSSAAGPGSEGVLTAGQLALTGAAKRQDPAKPDAVFEELKSSLKTDWKDWAVTEGDVRRVHEQLETLPPADYRKMMERMAGSGLLEKYLEEAEPSGRRDFLAQAERKGYVSSSPGEKAPFAILQPPDGPVFFRNEKTLPYPVREAIHGANVSAARDYYAAHKGYVKQYAERVREASNPLDIRRLGEPVSPFSTSEPGMDSSHPDYDGFRRSWSRAVRATDTRSVAYVAVSERMAGLSGIQRPGTFWFKAEAELKAELGPLALKLGGEVEATPYGKVKEKGKAAADFQPLKGIKHGVELDTSGKQKVSDGVEFKSPDNLKVGGRVDEHGTVKLELSVTGPFAVNAVVNPQEGKFGGGVSVKHTFIKDTVDAKVGVGAGMQGARPERARDIASREEGTLFGALPELEQGLAWGQLDPRRRERMRRDGWTERTWAEALQRPEPERR